MKCPKCGSDTRMMVQTCITAPGELYHNLPKAAYRRRDVELKGVLWETADFICTNEKCGHVTDGYGNYVTGLAKRVEELEAKAKCFDWIEKNATHEPGEGYFDLPSLFAWDCKPGPQLNEEYPSLEAAILGAIEKGEGA